MKRQLDMNKLCLLLVGLLGSGLLNAADADNPAAEEELTQSATQISAEIAESRRRLNEEIARIESEFDVFDRQLIEPLQGLTSIAQQLGDFETAGSLLERQLQLYRINEGPENPAQIPVVNALIENDIYRQEWDSVTDRFELILSLYEGSNDEESADVLAARSDLELWNYALVYLDEPRDRIFNFRDAREMSRRNVSRAEDIHAEGTIALAEWTYQEAILNQRVASLVESEDELGYDAARIGELIDSNVVKSS